MKRTFSLWLKTGFALFSVSVVGAAIVAFSHASDAPTPLLVHLTRMPNNVSQAVSVAAFPVAKAITREMIQERTASCAEMISAKDKLLCLNKRLKMKRDFRAQEKEKCDVLEGGAGKDQCFAELDILSRGLRSV